MAHEQNPRRRSSNEGDVGINPALQPQDDDIENEEIWSKIKKKLRANASMIKYSCAIVVLLFFVFFVFGGTDESIGRSPLTHATDMEAIFVGSNRREVERAGLTFDPTTFVVATGDPETRDPTYGKLTSRLAGVGKRMRNLYFGSLLMKVWPWKGQDERGEIGGPCRSYKNPFTGGAMPGNTCQGSLRTTRCVTKGSERSESPQRCDSVKEDGSDCVCILSHCAWLNCCSDDAHCTGTATPTHCSTHHQYEQGQGLVDILTSTRYARHAYQAHYSGQGIDDCGCYP